MTLTPVDTRPLAADEQASIWCLRLADGVLSPAEQEAFEQWLQTDATHSRALEDAVQAWQTVQQASSAPELIVMRTQALDTLRRRSRRRWSNAATRLTMRIASIAAVLLVTLVAGGMWWAHQQPKVYQTGVGERRVAVLPDGSTLSLDGATKVVARFDGGRRRLRLEYGRAKFDVAKDPLRPFSVAAGDKLVVAIGTEFSVELLRSKVHVILYEGRVSILRQKTKATELGADPSAVSQVILDKPLTPGRELVAAVSSDAAAIAPTDAARSLSWEAGQLVFADEPLASAVERVNRYAATPFEIGDNRAGNVLVSGVFTAGDTAAFAAGITGIFPVRVVNADGHHRFVSRAGSKEIAVAAE
jgi:transmembrane sensor